MPETPVYSSVAVAAPHHLAATAGQTVLAQGGNAIEAMAAMAATIAEVSIEGGAVRVHDVWIAVDPGSIVNPLMVESQMRSAASMGISLALLEEMVFEAGAPRAVNFDGYAVLPPDRMPRVHVRIVESGAPMGGIGEPGCGLLRVPAVADGLGDHTIVEHCQEQRASQQGREQHDGDEHPDTLVPFGGPVEGTPVRDLRDRRPWPRCAGRGRVEGAQPDPPGPPACRPGSSSASARRRRAGGRCCGHCARPNAGTAGCWR